MIGNSSANNSVGNFVFPTFSKSWKKLNPFPDPQNRPNLGSRNPIRLIFFGKSDFSDREIQTDDLFGGKVTFIFCVTKKCVFVENNSSC